MAARAKAAADARAQSGVTEDTSLAGKSGFPSQPWPSQPHDRAARRRRLVGTPPRVAPTTDSDPNRTASAAGYR